jgi:hypothetical protein
MPGPLCRDCFHHVYQGADDVCWHPNHQTNVVTGHREGTPCNTMRGPAGACGLEGRLWTRVIPPQPPLPTAA